jgi:hypothetical protein
VKVRCEVSKDGESWAEVGLPLGEGDILGSFADLTSGRDLYLFGIRDGLPGVWRAVGGTDQDFGELRKVETFGTELVTPLFEPHEMVVVHPSQGMIRLRFTRLDDTP